MPLKIEVTDSEGAGGRLAQVVHVTGEIDNLTCRDAEKALAPVIEAPFPHVILSLADLAYVSSAGVGVLLDFRRKLEAKKVKVSAVGMRHSIRKIFDIMQSLPASRVFASVQDLDDYLAAIQEATDDEDESAR